MNAHDAVLFNIRACGDPAVGRIALQKLTYLQTRLGVGIDAEYILDYYGPFSRKVATALAELVAFDYVCERRSAAHGYAYGLTRDGAGLADDARKGNEAAFEGVKRIVARCRDFLRPGPLSYAAKLHYIRGIDPAFAPEDVAGMFGWQMSDDGARMGQELLKRLGLDRGAPP